MKIFSNLWTQTSDTVTRSFKDRRLEWRGFVIGMVVVLAVAGAYRLSLEMPDSSLAPAPLPTRAPATQTKSAPASRPPTSTRAVLEKLDGPPEPLRRLQEQQNQQPPP